VPPWPQHRTATAPFHRTLSSSFFRTVSMDYHILSVVFLCFSMLYIFLFLSVCLLCVCSLYTDPRGLIQINVCMFVYGPRLLGKALSVFSSFPYHAGCDHITVSLRQQSGICASDRLSLPPVRYYFVPPGLRSIAMSMSVCLSVCLSVHSHNSKTAWPNFTKFFVHFACGGDSVLL